jgi:hypothetical protein
METKAEELQNHINDLTGKEYIVTEANPFDDESFTFNLSENGLRGLILSDAPEKEIVQYVVDELFGLN